MIVLGIDPGCTATGLAVVDTDAHKILELRTDRTGYPVEDVKELLDSGYPIARVAIQVPIPPTGKLAFYPGGKASPASLVRHAAITYQLVGYLERAAEIANADAAWTGWGAFDVVEVCSQGRRGQGLKMDAAKFNLYWGFTGRSSEHSRDAAAIALQGAKT